MPDARTLKDTAKRYIQALCDTDIDGMVALYAPDGSMEDPVGTPAHRGHDALRTFYGGVVPHLTAEIISPICVTEYFASFCVRGKMDFGNGTVRYLDAVDVFEFDDAGRIVRARAYWNPAEMRESPEPS